MCDCMTELYCPPVAHQKKYLDKEAISTKSYKKKVDLYLFYLLYLIYKLVTKTAVQDKAKFETVPKRSLLFLLF